MRKLAHRISNRISTCDVIVISLTLLCFHCEHRTYIIGYAYRVLQASVKDEKKQVVGKSMEIQDKRAETHLSEVVAALGDFARLSLYSGSVMKDEISRTPTKLLERLLELCAAQRGAVLLVMPP